MVPSDLQLNDGQPVGYHAQLQPGSSEPSPGFGAFNLPPTAPADPAAADDHALRYISQQGPSPAPPHQQMYPAPGSMAGQPAPVARHLGIRFEEDRAGGGAASGGGRRMSAAEEGKMYSHGSGSPAGAGMSQPYAMAMDGRQGMSAMQQYQPYAPIASTSSSPGFPPGASAQQLGYQPPYFPQQPAQHSPLPSPIPQAPPYHPQYQQSYQPYQPIPPQPPVSLPPGYGAPIMDGSAGPMFAPPPGQLSHSPMPIQQQPSPYPVASAYPTQGGMVYFMPRQQPGPAPGQPTYAPLPPPLLPGPSTGMYDSPMGGYQAATGRPPVMPSGLAMSMPLSASSSTSSLTPTGPSTSATPSSSSHHKRLAPDPSAPPSKPKKKKKAKSSKDQPKRFLCEFEGCGRAFARQFNLQTHAKSHYNIRDYDCAHCDKKFSRRHDRGRHCAAVHPEEPNEDLQASRMKRELEEGEEEGSGEEYPPDVRGLELP